MLSHVYIVSLTTSCINVGCRNGLPLCSKERVPARLCVDQVILAVVGSTKGGPIANAD